MKRVSAGICTCGMNQKNSQRQNAIVPSFTNVLR